MYKVELYVRVRRACMVEGTSTREAARVFGLHRDTVRKMLEYSVPPGYRRQSPPRRPKLDPYHGVIDRILEEDARFVSKSGVRTTLRTAAYNGRGYDDKVQRSGGLGCGRFKRHVQVSQAAPLTTVGNQQKWDSLRGERSGVGWRFRKLPEGPVVLSSPFDGVASRVG